MDKKLFYQSPLAEVNILVPRTIIAMSAVYSSNDDYEVEDL